MDANRAHKAGRKQKAASKIDAAVAAEQAATDLTKVRSQLKAADLAAAGRQRLAAGQAAIELKKVKAQWQESEQAGKRQLQMEKSRAAAKEKIRANI